MNPNNRFLKYISDKDLQKLHDDLLEERRLLQSEMRDFDTSASFQVNGVVWGKIKAIIVDPSSGYSLRGLMKETLERVVDEYEKKNGVLEPHYEKLPYHPVAGRNYPKAAYKDNKALLPLVIQEIEWRFKTTGRSER